MSSPPGNATRSTCGAGTAPDHPAVPAVGGFPHVGQVGSPARHGLPLLARRDRSVGRTAATDVRTTRCHCRAQLAASGASRERLGALVRRLAELADRVIDAGAVVPSITIPQGASDVVRSSPPRCAGRQPPARLSPPTSTTLLRRCHRSASPTSPRTTSIAVGGSSERSTSASSTARSRPPAADGWDPAGAAQPVGDDRRCTAGVSCPHRSGPSRSGVTGRPRRCPRPARRSPAPPRTSGPWRAGADPASASRGP